MNIRLLGFALLVLFIVTGCSVSETVSPKQGVEEETEKPWQLTTVLWELEKDTVCESVSIDFVISGSPNCNQTTIYLIPIQLQINGQGCQFGITDNILYFRDKQMLSPLDKSEPGVNFIRRDITKKDAVRAAELGYCDVFEKPSKAVCMLTPVRWKYGHYTLRLCQMDKEIVMEQQSIWVGGFLQSHETGETHYLGATRFSGSGMRLNKQTLYSSILLYPAESNKKTQSCGQLFMALGNIQIDHEQITPVKVHSDYDPEAPSKGIAYNLSAEPPFLEIRNALKSARSLLPNCKYSCLLAVSDSLDRHGDEPEILYAKVDD